MALKNPTGREMFFMKWQKLGDSEVWNCAESRDTKQTWFPLSFPGSEEGSTWVFLDSITREKRLNLRKKVLNKSTTGETTIKKRHQLTPPELREHGLEATPPHFPEKPGKLEAHSICWTVKN